jgi:hypothetical protein
MSKDSVVKTIIDRKDFSYAHKGVSLKFALPVDDSSSLRPFKSCLEEAIKDIEEILGGMKN